MKDKNKRILSLEKEFHHVIANFLGEDSSFHKNNINIIDVDIDESLARANVYYVTFNEERITNINRLERKVKNVIVNHFGSRIRRIPNIVFKYDRTFEKARKINSLIEGIMNKKNESN